MEVPVKRLNFFFNKVKFSYKFLVGETWLQIEEVVRTRFNLPPQRFVLIDMSDNYAVSHELLPKLVDDSSIYIELIDECSFPSVSTHR